MAQLPEHLGGLARRGGGVPRNRRRAGTRAATPVGTRKDKRRRYERQSSERVHAPLGDGAQDRPLLGPRARVRRPRPGGVVRRRQASTAAGQSAAANASAWPSGSSSD